MADWIEVAPEGSLAPGEHQVVDVDGVDVAVFNIEGEFLAIRDACTHDGGEIAGGVLEGCEIICPRHGARFCLKTGEFLSPPAYENIETYPVRLHEGRIQVGSHPNE
jgi:3-phenylpropionate/trans-cinnamate dioxygenase ferredoxin subunit